MFEYFNDNLDIDYVKNETDSKIFEVKNIITESMSKTIIEESEKMAGWKNVGFYKARILDQIDNRPEASETFRKYIDEYLSIVKNIISLAFGKPVRLKFIYIQKWPVGSYAIKHNDMYNFDGTPLFLDCKIAANVYMHNDFTGGKLEFPDHGISINPKQGSAYIFNGGPENEHQVTEIESGDRYTIVSFFDIEGSSYTEEELYMSLKSQEKWVNENNQKTYQKEEV